jgi:alpha-beta hydrolase superfamily lysophospholipase
VSHRRRFRPLRWLFRLAVFAFMVLNALLAFHAYKFTHYDTEQKEKLTPEGLTTDAKIRAALMGVSLPRPENGSVPSDPYVEIMIDVPDGRIHCWWVPVEGASASVILFHGYGDSKSSMVDRAGAFRRMGYNTLLVDFTGSGGSTGSETTIGFREGAEVRAALEWVRENHADSIHLFGMSLGAAAILKAVADGAQPTSVILECPFATLLGTVQNRFHMMDIPDMPLAQLLTFWGGVLHGFNAFAHNPQDYAHSVRCPALLMWGEADDRVLRRETNAIYAALAGPKTLATFPGVGHENYLRADREAWMSAVRAFLKPAR